MIAFWIVLAIALMLVGLFIFTQGGEGIGPALVLMGVVILLVLLVAPAVAGFSSA